jgi:hypothetical protein
MVWAEWLWAKHRYASQRFFAGNGHKVTASVRSFSNPTGTITNSDLEMAGVLILWLVMEAVCQPLQEKRVALFSDNSPAVGWTKRLASRKSLVAEHSSDQGQQNLPFNNTSH